MGRKRIGHFCAATIIHERWLITAAHCVYDKLGQLRHPQEISVRVGILNRLDPSEQEVLIERILPHPEYKVNHADNDIGERTLIYRIMMKCRTYNIPFSIGNLQRLALLELSEPLQFNAFVQAACLPGFDPDGLMTYADTYATVAGWGITQDNIQIDSRPEFLRKAEVKVWSNDDCEQSYRRNSQSQMYIIPGQLCAGYSEGKIDACMVSDSTILCTVCPSGLLLDWCFNVDFRFVAVGLWRPTHI